MWILIIFGLLTQLTSTRGNDQDGLLEDPPTIATGEGDLALQAVPLPVFLEEPTNTYVVKNKPATLRCRVAHALQVYFKCNGVRRTSANGAHHFEFVEPATGVRNVEASVNITRNEVEEFFGKNKFRCECLAWSSGGQVKSQSAVVDVAYLKKTFESPPYPQNVELDRQTMLRCDPPIGVPPPTVFWLKNGAVLEPDSNIIISSEGHLLISQARFQDTANYTCVAENIAGKRMSDTVLVKVIVNGGWSSWSSWSECSVRCGRGTHKRSRNCNNPAPMNGGEDCQGPSVQTEDCSVVCPAVDGKWSNWSQWSPCNTECQHLRKRTCTNPAPSNGGKYCVGKDQMIGSCVGGLCAAKSGDVQYDGAQLAEEAARTEGDSDLALYIGLAVALSAFLVLFLFIYRVLRKKGRDHSMYNMAASEYQPEYFQDQDKKNLGIPNQPDLTQTVVGINVHPCYEYPYSEKCGLSRSCSEHHYDVPHLSASQGASSSQSSSSKSTNHDGSSEKTPHSDSSHSISSFTCSSASRGSAYMLNSTIPAGLDPESTVSTIATSSGARLTVPGSNVSLTVPEGSLTRGQREETYISVLREDRHRPKLTDKQTLLSPVVLCGPPGLIFKKPVILDFPHCANLKHGYWSISVFCSDSPLEATPVWQKLVTLGEETINTGMFTQLDSSQVYLVTESLTRFCLVGESVSAGRAAKSLRLAVFGPATSDTADYSVRVYILEDTASSTQGMLTLEQRLCGVLLDKPRTLLFQDTNAPLVVTIEDIGPGWRAKPLSESVEVPFHHIWSGTHNFLHCSFSLERNNSECSSSSPQFRVLASQKGSPTHRQMFRVHADSNVLKPLPSPPKHVTVSVSSGYSSGMTSLEKSSQPFRIEKALKRKLCQSLDPPNSRGNDWRMFAQRLNVDRYITYFATKSSPTEHILDLWEARHREPTAVADLLNILRIMGRSDATALLESEMGAWL